MQSKAATVKQYLAELPPERRDAIAAVRAVILKNLPAGFAEGMQYGMIGYFVPHSLFPAGYHCDASQPLPYACLASQKNYMSLYLGTVYGDSDLATWFRAAWQKAGKKLDMGKSCIRFKRIEDVPLDVIGKAIKLMPVKKYIAYYEKALEVNEGRRAARSAAKSAAKNSAKSSRAKRATKGAARKKAAPRKAAAAGRAKKQARR
jgi:hypothetical protein